MKLTLPSGQRISLDGAGMPQREGVFASALALQITPGSVLDLPLGDFHVVRAVATREGLLEDEEIEITCTNCDAPMSVRSCSTLEIAPWVDGELDDPELDQAAGFDVPLEIEPIKLGRVRTVNTVIFGARTVRDALPLFLALGKNPFILTQEVVEAMGIRALGSILDPGRIARALMECADEDFAAVTDAWLDAHYVPRLGADVICTFCKARNTVDAPSLREFDRGMEREQVASALPGLAELVELAHAIGDPLLDVTPEPPELIVEDGIAAVDDGGVPLLGSYLPPPPKDAPVPMGPGTITIYFRTFEAMARDEPGWDWKAELRETIEHEIEHHVFFLRGSDPMDEAERAEIARDAVRVVGRTETARRELGGFGASIPDFFKRAWPLVLIAAVVLVISIAETRCSP